MPQSTQSLCQMLYSDIPYQCNWVFYQTSYGGEMLWCLRTLVQWGYSQASMEVERSACSLGPNSVQLIHQSNCKYVTGFIFYQLLYLLQVVYVAVVQNQDAVRTRIWICQWKLQSYNQQWHISTKSKLTTSSHRNRRNLLLVTDPSIMSYATISSSVRIGRIE